MAPQVPKQIRESNSARVHGDYEKRKKKLVRCDPLTRTEVAELWVREGDPNMEWCSDDYEARRQQIDTMLVLAMADRIIAWDELADNHWLVVRGHFPQYFWRKHLKLFAKDMDRAPKFLGIRTSSKGMTKGNMGDAVKWAQKYFDDNKVPAGKRKLYKNFAQPQRFTRRSTEEVMDKHFPDHLKWKKAKTQ